MKEVVLSLATPVGLQHCRGRKEVIAYMSPGHMLRPLATWKQSTLGNLLAHRSVSQSYDSNPRHVQWVDQGF